MRRFVDIPQRMARWEQTDGMERLGAWSNARSCTTQEELHYTRFSRPNALIKRRLPNATHSLPRDAFLGPLCVCGLWHVKYVVTHRVPHIHVPKLNPSKTPSGSLARD